MKNIHELNLRRSKLQQEVYFMGMMNRPSDYEEQLKSDAAYRLVRDAWIKAETEYTDALSNMTAEELEELVNNPVKAPENHLTDDQLTK